MNYYCTLFDSGYLTKGLALYNSIVNTGEEFKLFVFAFDDECYDILRKLKLPYIHPISLKEFESERLLKIKQTRSRGEYCWTCSSFSILHVLTHYNVPEVTYLDSDLYFFEKPQILLDEFHKTGKSVMITKHRYTPKYDQSKTSGIYCVQFLTFKNDKDGLNVINWWCDRCEEWCYDRLEDGKFGDQKYLDDWMTRFDCCYELEHLGGGVAPWNVQQYQVTKGPKVNNIPVVFFHFHALRWLEENKFDLSWYRLNDIVIEAIYKNYLIELKKAIVLVRQNYSSDFNKGFYKRPRGFISFLKYIKSILYRKVKKIYNIVDI